MTVPKGREPLNGTKLQKAIVETARRHGWTVAHFTQVKTEYGWRVPVSADGKGFPDLILVRDRLVAVEVKGDGDSMRPDQKKWQSALLMAGVEYHIWTPKKWIEGEIEELLSARVKPDDVVDLLRVTRPPKPIPCAS